MVMQIIFPRETQQHLFTPPVTWNPNMVLWKIIFFFKGVIFRFHVSFGGSKHGVNHMRVITGNISHKDGRGSQWTLAFWFHPIRFMYGIFTYIYHEFMVNVGKYTSRMDPISMVTLSTCLNTQEGHIKTPSRCQLLVKFSFAWRFIPVSKWLVTPHL